MQGPEMTIDDVSWAAGIMNIHENAAMGFWLLYLAVVVMSILVFNLGFARKLSLMKNIVVYGALLFGAIMLTFFAIFMPIVESLIAAALVLGIYRLRLRMHKKQKAGQEQTES
ncbi:hypothetical protein JCM19037_2475 [Geomicrobium sp. JCM 19037]|uniref:YlaH-like family protein n=1 Tax=unclassified Geomicrobium TaxID=2628951 RepID=UPI00045F238E|nr:YlaH-like family protein [Geomicrobium sp. JCM 19037]GAK04101.1 hypothetical protein JCM19037_2475 [Geomicrobium sp. JCM 19037]